MNADDQQILKDFQSESKVLIDSMIDILDECEGDFSKASGLEQYGQTVDRIMGGAKTLAMALDAPFPLAIEVGDYAGLCKAVGYKASQIKNNPQFYDVCVALLQDATEVLQDLIDGLFDDHTKDLKSFINKAFLERLKWVSDKFGAEYRASVSVQGQTPKMNQGDIDDLLKKLGLG